MYSTFLPLTGEEDMHNYDLSRLQKPVDIMTDAPYRGGGDPRRPPYQMELPRKGLSNWHPLHLTT